MLGFSLGSLMRGDDENPFLSVASLTVDIWISAAGNDSTGNGSKTNPFATYDHAYPLSVTGVGLIGDPLSPSVFSMVTYYTLNKAFTVVADPALGGVLIGSGATAAVRVGPTQGETITLKNVVFDGTQQLGGTPAQNLIYLTTQSVTYSLVLDGCTFTGWTIDGIRASAASLKANISILNCTATGDSVPEFFDCSNQFAAGGLVAHATTVTLTKQSLASHGFFLIDANASGVYCDISNFTGSMSIDPSLTDAANHSPILIKSIAAVNVRNSTITVSAAAGSRTSDGIMIRTNAAGNATELPVSNSVIANCTVNNFANGGTCFASGGEFTQDPAKQVGMVQQDNLAYGNAQSVTGGVHGHFMRNTTNSFMVRPGGNTLGAAIVDKLNSGLTITVDNETEIANATSTYYLAKGTVGTVATGLKFKAGAGYSGTMLRVEDDTGSVHSSVTLSNTRLTVDGATGIILVNVDANNTCNITGTTYRLISGTLATNPFQYQGVNYTAIQWLTTMEPTATFYTPKGAAWAALVVAGGGTVSAARLNLINAMYFDLNASGDDANIDDLFIYAAENQAQALVSLKLLLVGVPVNSPTFVPDRSVNFDGVSNYIDTGFMPSTMAVAMTGTDMMLGMYEVTNLASNGYAAGSFNSSARDLVFIPRAATSQVFAGLSATTTVYASGVTDSRGLISGYRTPANVFGAAKNGSSIGTATPTSNGTSLPLRSMFVGGYNNAGMTAPRATHAGYVVVGKSDIALSASFYATMQAYMTAIGAAV